MMKADTAADGPVMENARETQPLWLESVQGHVMSVKVKPLDQSVWIEIVTAHITLITASMMSTEII